MLGPLEVRDGERAVPVAGRQKALLGVLLVHANEVVSSERLIDAVWGERPPATAQAALQVHVSQLRKLLGAERIETRAPGYRLARVSWTARSSSGYCVMAGRRMRLRSGVGARSRISSTSRGRRPRRRGWRSCAPARRRSASRTSLHAAVASSSSPSWRRLCGRSRCGSGGGRS